MKGAIDTGDTPNPFRKYERVLPEGPCRPGHPLFADPLEAWDAQIDGQQLDRMNLLRKDQREVSSTRSTRG